MLIFYPLPFILLVKSRELSDGIIFSNLSLTRPRYPVQNPSTFELNYLSLIFGLSISKLC